MNRGLVKSKWTLPLFSAFLGVLVLVAFWIGGSPADGVRGLAVMVVLGALFLLGGRIETIRLMRQPDERWANIDLKATAITGLVIITVLIGAWLYELAQGRDGNPFGLIMAVGGVTYIAALILLRGRS